MNRELDFDLIYHKNLSVFDKAMNNATVVPIDITQTFIKILSSESSFS